MSATGSLPGGSRPIGPSWMLKQTIPNRYPFTGDFRLGSFSDFFIFERA